MEVLSKFLDSFEGNQKSLVMAARRGTAITTSPVVLAGSSNRIVLVAVTVLVLIVLLVILVVVIAVALVVMSRPPLLYFATTTAVGDRLEVQRLVMETQMNINSFHCGATVLLLLHYDYSTAALAGPNDGCRF